MQKRERKPSTKKNFQCLTFCVNEVYKGENSNEIYALLMMSRVKVRELITFY